MAGDTPHDVFISYSSKDKLTADAICATLERDGIRCWIAPRDVLASDEWAQSIVQAINGTSVFVLVFSAFANTSSQIRREVERAANREIPIIPFRIEDIPPHQSLEFFISTPHWMDALTSPLEAHIQRLSEAVQRLLARNGKQRSARPPKSALSLQAQAGWACEAAPGARSTQETGPADPHPAVRPGAGAPGSIDAAASVVPGSADTARPRLAKKDKPSPRKSPSTLMVSIAGGVAVLVAAAIAAFLFVPVPYSPSLSPDVASPAGVRRVEFALVATDPAKAAGPPLHSYGDPKTTYPIERDLTFPGDVKSIAAATDEGGRPVLDIVLAESARDRINSDSSIVGRQMALVLDGRTVLSEATVEGPLGTYIELGGGFTLESIRRLIEAISVPAATPAPAKPT